MSKDYYEKKLEDYKDVFADIINVLLFNGESRAHESELESGMTRSGYLVDGKLDEQERDAKKIWKENTISISAVFGLENQSSVDPSFSIRGLAYDGADYRDQIRKRDEIQRENSRRQKNGEEPLSVPDYCPVITIVLFFSDHRWTGPRNLRDYLSIPDGLERFVPDYTVNVIEIAYLTDQQVSMFQSDFRFVAEYFVGIRKRKEGLTPEYHFRIDQIKHTDAIADLMNALSNSTRFDILRKLPREKGDKVMYTEIFDEIEEKAEKRGRDEERINTQREAARADAAESKIAQLTAQLDAFRQQLDAFRQKYGDVPL